MVIKHMALMWWMLSAAAAGGVSIAMPGQQHMEQCHPLLPQHTDHNHHIQHAASSPTSQIKILLNGATGQSRKHTCTKQNNKTKC
jgi:hypothetical protein